VLPVLRSPDSLLPLRSASNALALTDGRTEYAMRAESPMLYPSEQLNPAIAPYLAVSRFRQSGEINASPDGLHYARHVHRMRAAAASMRGLVLDVGCDDTSIGAALLPASCTYLGLDPFAADHESFRLIGIGEALPIADASLDGVMFNTSLDHILDYVQALLEARRVLRPGGLILLSTLLWTDRATMLPDAVHFHHFKGFELYGALEYCGFDVVQQAAYPYKDDAHRHGLYLTARRIDLSCPASVPCAS
jgi:SAM-dependent methyltransferase